MNKFAKVALFSVWNTLEPETKLVLKILITVPARWVR